MSLVHPAALFLGALAIPIVVFYILKIRLRRVPVSTLLFWEQIFEEKKPRSLWQRLRHWISLLLQLAFLALLVFAVGDPIFRWQQARARRVVLVVDNSASMEAGDVLPNRLEAAKTQGRRLIDGMRLGDELAIIVAEPSPRVACGLTDHAAHSPRGARLDRAGRRADSRCGGRDPGAPAPFRHRQSAPRRRAQRRRIRRCRGSRPPG